MQAADAESEPGIRRRWQVLIALAVVAALLHAGALSGLDWAWPQRDAPPLPSPAMQVRSMAADAPAAAPDSAQRPAEPAPLAAPTSRPQPAAVERRSLMTRQSAVTTIASAAPAVATASLSARGAAPAASPFHAPAPAPSPVPAPASPETLPAPAEAVAQSTQTSIPHYRTRLPPAVTLRYDLQRGPLRGTGELQWHPGADGYELKLESRVAGLAVLTQISQGGFDAHGIAPQRFTDRRARRPLAAANFQREAGKITYSGPPTAHPLHPGAQDRLSWMIQLGAIVAAEPSLGVVDAKLVLFVSGANGDAGVWVFRCSGLDEVPSRAGPVAAIRFRREPRGPYDSSVDVWLDPLRHHLPVRATLRAGPNDDGFDLILHDLQSVP